MIILELLNEFMGTRDVQQLADTVQVLADKWDGMVDFWKKDCMFKYPFAVVVVWAQGLLISFVVAVVIAVAMQYVP